MNTKQIFICRICDISHYSYAEASKCCIPIDRRFECGNCKKPYLVQSNADVCCRESVIRDTIFCEYCHRPISPTSPEIIAFKSSKEDFFFFFCSYECSNEWEMDWERKENNQSVAIAIATDKKGNHS